MFNANDVNDPHSQENANVGGSLGVNRSESKKTNEPVGTGSTHGATSTDIIIVPQL